jgi:hypothetical protein
MNMTTLKNLGLLMLASFIVGAGLALIDSNLTNLFVADKATWQVILTGGVMAAASVAVLYFTPLTSQFGLSKKTKTP